MNKLVFLTQDIHQIGKDYLESKGYSLKLSQGTSNEDLLAGIRDCDAVILRLGKFDKALLSEAKKLQFIARHGTGLDNVDLAACKELGIALANDPIANVNAVAEHVLAMIVALSKNLMVIQNKFKQKGFKVREEYQNVELKNKTLGIIGLGKIGSLIAKKAHFGFDMKVICYDPYCTDQNLHTYCEFTKDVRHLLAHSDFVTINTPCTPETRGFFDKEKFDSMKKGAFFINAARGELVVENDLIFALKNGHLAGAGLDVFEKEPLPLDHELLQMEQVVVSPHNAALTVDALQAMSLNAAMRVDEFFTGKEVLYRVV